MLEKGFSAIDVFGIPILLNFSKSKKAQSSFGGFCSLLFVGFIIWAIYTSGYELIARQKPQIVAGTSYSDTREPIDISSRELPVMFGLQINGGYDSNLCEYFYAPMNDQGQTGTFSGMEICTSDHFDPSFGDLGDVSRYYCLPSSPEVKQVTGLMVFMSCLFQDFTEEDFISQAPVTILMYPKDGMTLNSYKNPVQYYFDVDFIPLAGNTTFLSSWSLNPLSITTDNGWLTTNEKTEQYIEMKSQYNRNVQNNQGKSFVSFVFSVSNQQTYYLRPYKKIQNVLAEVGGMAGAVFTVLTILVIPFARIKFSEAVVNELFETQAKTSDKTRNTQESKLVSHNQTLRENESKAGISPKGKANEDISKTLPNENEGLLLQTKYDTESPDKPRSPQRRVHTQPVPSEPWPRLENNKQNDGKNDNNANLGGIELVLPAESHSNYKNHDKCVVNIKEEKQRYEDQPKDLKELEACSLNPKKEELVVEEGDLQLDIIETEKVLSEDLEKQSDKNKTSDKLRKESSKPKGIKSERITISILEYVWSFVSKSESLKQKMTILNEGVKIMNERLDIFILMKKLRDIDKMKGLILDKDQLFLFNRTSRPEIMNRTSYWYTEENLYNDALFGYGKDMLIDAKQRLEDKPHKSEIDHKLISLFSKSE